MRIFHIILFCVAEKLLVFVLEIWCEHAFAHVVFDVAWSPKAATAQFLLAWSHLAVVHATEDVYEFSLPFAFKDIMAERLWCEVGDAKFLPYFSLECLVHVLPKVDVTAHGGVPLVGLNVFPCRSMLEIELSLAVEHVQVNHGVQYLAAVVGVSAAYCAKDVPVLVHYRELFVRVVSHDASYVIEVCVLFYGPSAFRVTNIRIYFENTS